MNKNKTKFCSRPFTYIYTTMTGDYKLCCKAKNPKGLNINETTPYKWFTSDEMNDIRDVFLNDDPTTNPITSEMCSYCWKLEDQGIKSFRESSNISSLIDQEYARTNFINGEYNLDSRIISLQLSIFGNHCNLACIMCWPASSSRRTTDLKKIPLLNEYLYNNENIRAFNINYKQLENGSVLVDEFIKHDLIKLLPYINNINFVGGEPLMLYDHYKVLDVIIDSGHSKHITLGYTSNITKLKCRDKNWLDYPSAFKKVVIKSSIDGHGKYYEYIRQHSKWDTIIKNVKILQDIPNVDLRVVMIISSLTVLQIVETYIKLISMGLEKIDLDSNIVIKPTFLNARYLPQEIKNNLLKEIPNLPVFDTTIKILKQEGNEYETKMMFKYLDDIDKLYNVSYKDIWPELINEKEY